MKTLIKVTLVLSLCVSTLFADGQMGSGGYQGCTGEDCPPPCTENCPPPCTEGCGRPEGEGDNISGNDVAKEVMKKFAELYFLGR